MTTIHPNEFLRDYVVPAIKFYGEHRLEKHLAVNALSQMDNLAEVVALYRLLPERSELRPREASQYREELRERWPVLGIIRDAHDCHKHGRLDRPSAKVLEGMASGRPERTTQYGFFVGETECGGDLPPYDALSVTLNDGSEPEVFELLAKALQAWNGEFQRLGLT